MRPLFATRRARWLARLALYGGFVLLGLPLAFSQVLVGTIRQPTAAAAPPWTEAPLEADGLRLRSWLVRGETSRPAVVVVHGLGDSLESYRDLGETFHRRGHTVLLLDLRGHGGSAGRVTTLGGAEREDVRAGMRMLRAQGLARQGFVLLGVSMGAVAVLRAAAAEPDVRAVIAEAPYDTYRETVAHHAGLYYGLPRWLPLIPAAVAVAEWRAGFDADEVDAVAAARSVSAPLLAIVDGADPRMPEAVVRRVFDAHPGPKRFWIAPGATHAGAGHSPGYWPEVLGFLEANGLQECVRGPCAAAAVNDTRWIPEPGRRRFVDLRSSPSPAAPSGGAARAHWHQYMSPPPPMPAEPFSPLASGISYRTSGGIEAASEGVSRERSQYPRRSRHAV